jgi:hypothetical protein
MGQCCVELEDREANLEDAVCLPGGGGAGSGVSLQNVSDVEAASE